MDENLSASDYQNVIDALNQKVDLSDINTSSWIPGNDWTGTVYEPLIMLVEITKMPPVCFLINSFDLLMRREDAVWGLGDTKRWHSN